MTDREAWRSSSRGMDLLRAIAAGRLTVVTALTLAVARALLHEDDRGPLRPSRGPDPDAGKRDTIPMSHHPW
jgi:hypothetical protein